MINGGAVVSKTEIVFHVCHVRNGFTWVVMINLVLSLTDVQPTFSRKNRPRAGR